MILRQVLELFDLLDTPAANGKQITELLKERGAHEVTVETVTSEKGSTDCITVLIKGSDGKSSGGSTRLWASSDAWEAWERVLN